jgi:mono/diheme cytochrome c family protein
VPVDGGRHSPHTVEENMRNGFAVVALSGLLAGVVLAGCGDREAQPEPGAQPAPGTPPAATPPAGPPVTGDLPAGVTAQMVQEGQQIFNGQGICYTCHGQNGAGSPIGPALNDQNWVHLTDGSLEEIEAVIRTGVQQPRDYPSPMPPMGGARLSDDQLRAVSAYVYGISRGT